MGHPKNGAVIGRPFSENIAANASRWVHAFDQLLAPVSGFNLKYDQKAWAPRLGAERVVNEPACLSPRKARIVARLCRLPILAPRIQVLKYRHTSLDPTSFWK